MKIKKLLSLLLICSVIATYFVQSTVTVNAADAIKGDINNDAVINMADVILLAGAFNAMNGDSKYSPAYDFNDDGVINMADVIIIAGNFGKSVPKVTPTPTKAPTPTPTHTQKPTPTPTAAAKFHCFLLMGQSNMAGFPRSEAADKVEDPRILVLGFDNNAALGRVKDQWDVACPPLHDAWLDAIGPGDWFAKTIINKLPSGDTIGLIPCAFSGKSVDYFSKGTSQYSWIISRAKLAQQKGGIIEGIIFHQGESDSGQSSWPGRVSKLVSDLKQDLGLGDIPFLAGELLYSGSCAGHNQLVRQLPSLISNCHVVSAQGLTKDPTDTYNVHFGHDAQVELGKRYAAKMAEVLGW